MLTAQKAMMMMMVAAMPRATLPRAVLGAGMVLPAVRQERAALPVPLEGLELPAVPRRAELRPPRPRRAMKLPLQRRRPVRRPWPKRLRRRSRVLPSPRPPPEDFADARAAAEGYVGFI